MGKAELSGLDVDVRATDGAIGQRMIDWGRIGRAMDYYARKGFTVFDAAWHAPRDIARITCPEEARLYAFDGDALVGSAEQSFMAAMFDGRLPPGRYVACTPCFRREPVVDATHHLYFMKVELFEAGAPKGDAARALALAAHWFMQGETPKAVDLVPTEEGYDLEIGGIEVGSYSSRKWADMEWTCGTGLAEPRFGFANDR